MSTVVKYDNIAKRDDTKDETGFVDQGGTEGIEKFPERAESICLAALTIAAEGSKADVAKPIDRLKGLKEMLR